MNTVPALNARPAHQKSPILDEKTARALCSALSCKSPTLIPSAKSGSDWTENELHAFNIRVASVGTAQFFGNAILPPAAISPAILNNAQMPHGLIDDRLFFEYLTDAERASSEESAVVDFATHILRTLDYDNQDRRIRTRKEIPFIMSGWRVGAKTDVCVMDYLLFVQEDKVSGSVSVPISILDKLHSPG